MLNSVRFSTEARKTERIVHFTWIQRNLPHLSLNYMSFSEIASDDGFQQAHMRFLTLSEPRHKRNQKNPLKTVTTMAMGKKRHYREELGSSIRCLCISHETVSEEIFSSWNFVVATWQFQRLYTINFSYVVYRFEFIFHNEIERNVWFFSLHRWKPACGQNNKLLDIYLGSKTTHSDTYRTKKYCL